MDDMVRYPHLLKRGNVFTFRAKVPADLVEAFGGKRQVWESLRTCDPAEAKRRVRDKTDAFEQQCQRVRERVQGESVGTVELTSLDTAAIEAMVREWFATDNAEREARFRASIVRDRDSAIEDAEFWQSVYVGGVESQDGSYELFYRAMKLLKANDIRLVRRKLDPIRQRNSPLPYTVTDRDAQSQQYVRLLALIRRAEIEGSRREIERLKGNFADVTFDPAFSKAGDRGKTLAEVIAAFRNAPERATLVEKSRRGFDATASLMEELFGGSRALSTLTREDCKCFRTHVMELPTNARQRYPGKSLKESVEASRGKDVPRLHPTTVNHYLHSLSAVMNFAVREGWIAANPAKGLAPKVARQRNGRDSFSKEELIALFKAPLFTGCANDRAGYATPGDQRPRNGKFWLPLIALFTGMRQGEIAQLLTSDVGAYQGVACIFIRPSKDTDEADLKRVKTEAGVRFVPVHPQLIELGFLRFVEQRAAERSNRLFPELKRGSDGYFSPYSKWFGRFLRKAGVKHSRNAFHSFRHTFRDAMSEAAFHHDVIVALGGWRKGGLEHRYGAGPSAALLAGQLGNLCYPGLDLSALNEPGLVV